MTRAPDTDLQDNPALARLFDDTRKRLVETGTRNRLVHVNRQNTRGNVVNIVNERSEDVYGILAGGKAMKFLAIGRDVPAEDEAVKLADAGEAGFDAERYADSHLETRLGPDALAKRLLKTAREAQTAEDESGVNVLYLALGFLTWVEDKSPPTPREAPLILLPVQLVRNQRTSTYDLRLRDEDVVTNLPLQQRLKDDFGIALPELDIGEDWTPAAYFAAVQQVVAAQPSWKLDADAMQLGFFSFSKLLMYRDLAPDAWPDGALAGHALTRGLLFEGFDAEPPAIGPDDRLDDVLPPARMVHVVDADASQAIVIEEARRGRNLVVQGPPGTGKSQTITNIIAAAVSEGKRVLFVAEKMAALSVVHDRLVKVGLRDVCLELHSRTASKKDILAELARTITRAAAVPGMPGEPTALTGARDRLNAIAGELHTPIGTSGETPFDVLGAQARFIGTGAPAPVIDGTAVASLDPQQLHALLDTVARYGAVLAAEGDPAAHPFAGVGNLELQPVDMARLAALLTRTAAALGELDELALSIAAGLSLGIAPTLETSRRLAATLAAFDGLPPQSADLALAMLALPDPARLRQVLEGGAAWRAARDAAAATFVDAAFDAQAAGLRAGLVAGTQSWFARWGGAYRGASRELAGMLRGALPKKPPERLALLDALLAIHAQKARWQADEAFAVQALGAAWRQDATEFVRLVPVAAWAERARNAPLACTPEAIVALAAQPERLARLHGDLQQRLTAAAALASEAFTLLQVDGTLQHGELAAVAHRLGRMAAAVDRYDGWRRLQALHAELVHVGVPDVAEKMRSGGMAAPAAATEIRFARAEHLWKVARESSPQLREIGQLDRHRLVADFAALERARLKDNVTTIVAAHLAQVPQGAMGEMKVIRGEIGKKRGHIALRKLFSSAGNALQRIKPVMLMSPISVAQYIPPGAMQFDLLVIDEASQVRPEDALGAIARAAQIVVVGDQKQLPPSSFFDRLLSDEAEGEADEEEGDGADLLGSAAKIGAMESVLSLCEARGLGSRMLRWHYRSRDPSLIQVSNREFYAGQLILPPSPLQKDPAFGLTFTRVNGVYDRGAKRDNRLEGEAIVARVAEHARAQPDVSLGIVTFSSAQKNLIAELLELQRRTDPVLNDFLREGQAESVFVKNIENVQGDERDVILVSVCYGPSVAGGRLTSMTFGPVNGEGGERRLNVLFTRARLRCEVFASFDPADIDPGRTTRDGVRILKHFLEFAKGDEAVGGASVAADAATPFEQDVAEAIRGMGYLADPHVGSAGFRIDMGIRHPDRPGSYLLAVECDGATYRGAQWARERDRLRRDVLEHLGWRFHRVWSTDWFYRRKEEIERLRATLESAHALGGEALKITGANHGSSMARPPQQVVLNLELPEVTPRHVPLYQRCYADMGSGEPHETPPYRLAELVLRIVREEGPVHVEEVARRIAFCFGKEKAGTRILGLARTALDTAGAQLQSEGDFWYTAEQAANPPVRDRTNETGATQKPATISMLELRAALALAREDNAGGQDADLIRYAARLLGFKRVGTELQERLALALREGAATP